MRALVFLFLLLMFMQLSCNSQQKKINGISFVASRDTISKEHIAPVIKVQGNHVALMPFGFIRDLSSPEVIHNTNRQWFGETKNGLLQYAKRFQEEKISIMVKPHIWIRRGMFTGDLKMESEENWKLLEASYRSFILSYAKAAENLNADIFCIGTELEKFVLNRPVFWLQLIEEIRNIFKGKLTYAANWDEYKRVKFWQKIDYIGIDAYFPLSDKKTPSIKDFELGWQPHKKEILQVQQQFNKPVLFTEFGYRSVDFNAKEPWKSDRIDGNINLAAQANGLQAIHNQFWKEDWFAGGFIWKWFHTHDKVGGEQNNRFTPQNKPAEEIIRKLYQQN